MALLLGFAGVLLIWWLLATYAQADLKRLMPLLRKLGGVAALAVAALLLLRGRIDMAIAVGGAGLWLLGQPLQRLGLGRFGIPGIGSPAGWGGQSAPGGRSNVRSVFVEMELDHATGEVSGRIIAGSRAGRELATLTLAELVSLREECLASDPDGARLLEAYLDRRFPGWRVDAQGDGDPRTGQHAGSGALSEEEAYKILGLAPGASAEDIRRAHRSLMKKLHPDQGGSTYLATRVNEAKDVLLARHS